MATITKIRKRNGEIATFQQQKITEAIWNAAKSVGGTNHEIAEKIAGQVTTVLEVFFKSEDQIPSVEQIQDLVEKILIENGHAKTAKAYILYREEHNKLRQQREKILNTKEDILIKLPGHISHDEINELLSLAEKFGCHYETAQQNDDDKDVREAGGLESEHKNSHSHSPRLKKMVEEIIPPPIEALV